MACRAPNWTSFGQSQSLRAFSAGGGCEILQPRMKDVLRLLSPGTWLCRALMLALLTLVLVPAGTGRAATPTATTVLTNPSFETLAVDAGGTAWGRSVDSPAEMYRSSDEGATWTRVSGWDAIGRRPWYITPLVDGTLLAAYDTGFHWTIARSADHGATWTPVLSLPCIQPDCTVRYTTLGANSIAQGDGYVFLGTYSNASPATNTNFIYRSADDGLTWSTSNTSTQFRHVHGLEFDPVKKRLYVLFGDSDGMATWYSADDGVTLQPLCTAYACTSIEAAVDPTGSDYVSSSDNPGQTNHIFEVDTTTGARTVLDSIPYPSYSSIQDGKILLVAETHEPGAITDPNIDLYGSSDGGATWSILYAFAIPSTDGYWEMYVENVFPDGDIAVQVAGQGTVVLRPSVGSGGGGGGSPPGSVSAPVVSGSAAQGQVLSASTGGWSGSPSAYAYQWRRCNSSGASCADIGPAAASSYLVQAGDVGSTLRVRVTASNGSGAGPPADSAATAVVTASGGGAAAAAGRAVWARLALVLVRARPVLVTSSGVRMPSPRWDRDPVSVLCAWRWQCAVVHASDLQLERFGPRLVAGDGCDGECCGGSGCGLGDLGVAADGACGRHLLPGVGVGRRGEIDETVILLLRPEGVSGEITMTFSVEPTGLVIDAVTTAGSDQAWVDQGALGRFEAIIGDTVDVYEVDSAATTCTSSSATPTAGTSRTPSRDAGTDPSAPSGRAATVRGSGVCGDRGPRA